jgi:PAS domain S-box-containing protein
VPVEAPARLRGTDGTYRWFLFRAQPSADASGQLVKWCGLGTDIDERMQAEEALRASEHRFRSIVDGLPVLLSTATPDGELDQANRHYLEYFGATLEELKAREAVHGVHPDDRERLLPVRKAAIEAGSPYEIECRRRRADGVYRWFYLRAFPLRDAQGRVVLWYRLQIDIEEQKKAERELQLTIDSIPTLVATYRPDGSRIFVNQTWRDYSGLSPETAAEAERIGFIHPDDAERVNPQRQKSLATGVPFQAEVRLRRADGEYRWYLVHRVAARDESGAIVKWYSVAADIDDRKRAEQKAVEAERELRMTLDSIPVITWRGAANGYVQQLNKRWFEYTGSTPEQARGRRWKSCVHADDLEPLIDAGTRYVAAGAPIDTEARLRRFDGVYRWFLFRPAPARDEDGKIIGWYGTITDIEDRKRAEQKAVEAERELQRTIDHIPVLVATYRPDGSRLYINKQVREYTDRTAAEDWERTIHPDDIELAESKWRACVASGEQFELEFRVRMADSTYRWHLTRRVPLRDEAGKIIRWYGIGYDIEDRKRAEEELRRSEAFLAKAQRLSLTGSFSFYSATGEFTWSEELYRIFEFQPGIRVTLPLIDSRYHPEDRHVMEETTGGIRRGAAEFDYEHRLLMPDGSIKWVHVVAQASSWDKDGSGLEYFGAVQDMTQRRVAEAALDKARSELVHVTRVMSLGALTASIAHEVNQPLAGIITNASTCLRMLAADPPNVRGALETARRTIRDGNRAADVITRLRALFSKKAAATETVDLNEAAREVLTLVFSDLLRNRVSLQAEIDDEHPVHVTGDRVQLQQVILNLVRNAADAMQDVNDRPRHLLVKVEREREGGARFIVRDSGLGLDPQSLERLFDAFYTTKADGMGIGLSVSRSIIENHGGKLWAETNDGPGATFSFSIPPPAETATDDRTGGGVWTHQINGRDAMRNS